MISKITEALRTAVQECLGPDPSKAAIFLSGGLDSAVIQAIARLPSKLYCITWPEQDNISLARIAALGGKVTLVTFTREQMLEALPAVSKACDPAGSGSWSQVCQWFAAQQAARDGADRVLTGETSDEIFGGYSRYRILWHIDQIFADPLLESYLGIIKHVLGTREQIATRMLSRTLSEQTASSALADYALSQDSPGGPSSTLVDMARRVDYYLNLPPLMVNETRMIQSHGLKACYPFAHQAVLDAAAQIPGNAYITQRWNKAPLREAGQILGVPDEILDERTKKGLFIPQAWRPENSPMWSTSWFTELMRSAAGQ